MSDLAGHITSDKPASLVKKYAVLLQFLLVIIIGVALSFVWDGASRWPQAWVVPLKLWITEFFNWLGKEAGIGDYKFRDLTRGISAILKQPLQWTEIALYRGVRSWGAPPLPWIAITIGIGIVGHWINGWRLAFFAVGCFLYLAVFGLWKDSMRTLAIVLVSVPVAAIIGLFLGIWVTRSKRAASIITPMFDLMQATPHMAYLVPIVVLFGFGQVPAMMATVIFAMPPMARCTILGLQTVPSDIVESGAMSGCTPRQILWKVELPSAHHTIMLGLNQVIMQTLAMVVIASLVGASGLGQKLLFSLQQLRLGAAIEQGLAIVLIAVVLDRLSQGLANRQPNHLAAHQSWLQRHKHLMVFIAVLVVAYLLALAFPALAILPKSFTISLGRDMDYALRWFSKEAYPYISPVRDFITVEMLIPLRNFFLWLPWPVVLATVMLAGWRLGGPAVAGLTGFLVTMIIITGFWVPAMLTVYLVLSAVIICILVGVPIGIWSARNPTVARFVMATCDTLQTFRHLSILFRSSCCSRLAICPTFWPSLPMQLCQRCAIRISVLKKSRRLSLKRPCPTAAHRARNSGRWNYRWRFLK